MDSRRPGHFLLVSSGLALGFHIWLSRGAFLVLQSEGEGLEHLFISAGIGSLVVALLLGPSALYLVHLLITRATARHGATKPTTFTLEDVSWATPLLLFWASALAFLTVLPGLGRAVSVLSFFVVDLRWWWTAIVVVTTAFGIYRRLHSPSLFRLSEFQLPRLAPEVALAAMCALCAVAWTPNLRFSAETHGDEPRYLRYCENFYQGHGLEISSVRPIADLPSDFNSRFGRNLVLVAETLPGELRNLMSDARLFLSDPAHRFVRSETSGGFIRGKTGGVYQKHQPGLSLLMLPAYYIDRTMTPAEPGSKAQWPRRLIAVNTFFLALYLVWVVLIFRFVRRLVERAWIAWLTALTIGLTMPVVAFPFQMYAEIPAGVLLFLIAGHLLSSARTTPATSLSVGVLTGYLPWLHVRFSALAAVLVIAGIVALRRDSRHLFSFLAGFVIPLIFLALYAYRLTGSVLPSALWHDEDSPALSSVGALRGSVGYLIDSQRGLFAHSPIYLLALPGYWLLAKYRRDLAWLCLFVFLSVLLPSAAHTFSGAMSPNRLIVAVVPFAAIPMAVVIARYAHSRAFQAAFAVLLVLSVQNAWAYNWSHVKYVSRMIDRSFSGWKINLLFPAESRTPWDVSNANGWLYVGWVAVLIGLLFGPALFARMRPRGSHAKVGHREWNLQGLAWARESAPRLMLVMALLIVVLGTTVAASTGVWDRRDFRMPATSTARRAAGLLDAMGGCVLCLSSAGGRVTTDQTFSRLVLLAPSLATRGKAVGRDYADWLAMPGRIRTWYVEANGREPSNEDIGHYLFQWREERSRPEDIRRRIFGAAKKAPPP